MNIRMAGKQKEYQSVILGALLHDIGKFTEKQFNASKSAKKHPHYSETFITDSLEGLLKDKNWVDLNTDFHRMLCVFAHPSWNHRLD